jgi:hypothetical protein
LQAAPSEKELFFVAFMPFMVNNVFARPLTYDGGTFSRPSGLKIKWIRGES